jgi:glycine/D-amino acid oxidase-like deaminating enzyme
MPPPARFFDFVVAGAGVSAIAAARHLARRVPTASIALVTPHAPMSQTSSLSTECFRNHWPSAAMRAFMTRSIELIDEQAAAGGAFRVTRAGYLFCSNRAGAADALAGEARACHGANVRDIATPAQARAAGCAPWTLASPGATGADVYSTRASALEAFPYLAPETEAAMHARNAGWVSAQTMGMDMLDALRERRRAGDGAPLTTLIKGRVVGADAGREADRVRAVFVRSLEGAGAAADAAGERIECGAFINATGPFLKSTHRALLGEAGERAGAASALPVFSEVHSKVIFRDTLRVVPRDAPQVILVDPVAPVWQPEELEYLAETFGKATADRAGSVMAGGAHFRPYGGEGSDAMLLLWESWHHGIEPSEPPPESADQYLDHRHYPDIALRGLARMVPGLAAYFDEDARAALRARQGGAASADEDALKPPRVDGGYYTKTVENIPLIGPAPGPGGRGKVDGAFICGAVSGYGIMASHAAGELAAAHATGASDLAERFGAYADLMTPLRHQSDAFMRKGGVRDQLLAAGGGQL